MVSYQGFMFLFTQKPHNAVGCQESEQLDKVQSFEVPFMIKKDIKTCKSLKLEITEARFDI